MIALAEVIELVAFRLGRALDWVKLSKLDHVCWTLLIGGYLFVIVVKACPVIICVCRLCIFTVCLSCSTKVTKSISLNSIWTF